MATNDFFSGIFGDPAEQQRRREQQEDFAQAQLNDQQWADFTSMQAGRGIGRGVGELAGAALGVDMREPTERVKAEMAQSGLQPGTDEYYLALIASFNKNGLPDAANRAAAAWESLKRERAQTRYYEGQAEKAERVPEQDQMRSQLWKL